MAAYAGCGPTLPGLHRASIDVLGAQRPGIQTMQGIDIDRRDLRAIGHRAVRKPLYAARLAEQVCDGFFVESILRQVVFAFQKLEL